MRLCWGFLHLVKIVNCSPKKMFINPLGAICLIFLAVCSVRSQDRGVIRSCDPSLYQFSLDWTPRPFRSGESYIINLSTVAAKSFTRGRWCLKIWMHGVPDPIYDDCRSIECRVLSAEARRYGNYELPCPISPGYRVDIRNFAFTIDPNQPLPGGHFHINATLDNENNERFLCVMGDLEIADDFDEDF